MAKNKNQAKEKPVTILDIVTLFMRDMETMGYKCSIQFSGAGTGTTHISSMDPIETLGALEYARIVTSQGLKAHQAFDTIVQLIENSAVKSRPDLVNRLKKAMKARGQSL